MRLGLRVRGFGGFFALSCWISRTRHVGIKAEGAGVRSARFFYSEIFAAAPGTFRASISEFRAMFLDLRARGASPREEFLRVLEEVCEESTYGVLSRFPKPSLEAPRKGS